MAVGTVLSLGAAQSPTLPERRVIRVRAERFAFTPSEIAVKSGETVEFRIKSDDTAHGFRIVGTDTDLEIPKRGKGEISVFFIAKATGDYTFECNQMCGAGHDFMRGVIKVRADPSAGEAR